MKVHFRNAQIVQSKFPSFFLFFFAFIFATVLKPMNERWFHPLSNKWKTKQRNIKTFTRAENFVSSCFQPINSNGRKEERISRRLNYDVKSYHRCVMWKTTMTIQSQHTHIYFPVQICMRKYKMRVLLNWNTTEARTDIFLQISSTERSIS